MLKTLSTLLRGAAAAAEEDFTDRNALLILDQQIRDVAAGVERSKGALALAIAQEEAERERLERTRARIKDLEERGVAALRVDGKISRKRPPRRSPPSKLIARPLRRPRQPLRRRSAA
jgi:phage shock protein A